MKKLYPILLIILLFALKSERIELDSRFVSSYRDYNEFYRTHLTRISEKHSSRLLELTESLLRSSDLFSYVDKKVIIDTTIVNRYMKEGGYYIKTRNSSAGNFLCDLKCSKDLYDEINRTDNRHYLLAVKINSVKAEQNVIELDSIDNRSLFVTNGHNVIISGECLDAVGLPYESIFTLD